MEHWLEQAENKIEKLENKMFKLTILFVIVLTTLGSHYSGELFKLLKVII